MTDEITLTETNAEPDYKGFVEAIMEDWAAHGDIDAEDKFDLAVKFNILRAVPGGYDPEKHSSDWYDAERGDPWYEMNCPKGSADQVAGGAA